MSSLPFGHHICLKHTADLPKSSHTLTISITKDISLTAHPELQAAVTQVVSLQTSYLTMVVLSRQVVCGFYVWQMSGVGYLFWHPDMDQEILADNALYYR